MHPSSSLSLGILAGGTARRFGGRDKGMLVVDGETLVGRLIRQWSPHCAATIVNTQRNAWFYTHQADRVVSDAIPDSGPCLGLAALLSACTTPLLLVAPCDLTRVEPLLPVELCNQLRENDPGLYVTSDSGQHQLVLLLRQALLGDVGRFIDADGRSVQSLITTLGLRGIEYAPGLQDVDSPEALASL